MEWLCECGKPVTTLELLWDWRDAAAIGHRHGRYVCYGCRLGCAECVPPQADRDYEYFQVKLTARTKQDLVRQIVAEVIGDHPRGYLPKTDLQRALRSVRKAPLEES